MLFSEIIEAVGKYFNNNIQVFKKYLETLSTVEEVEEFLTHINGYEELCDLAKIHKERLAWISVKDETTGELVDKRKSFPSITTTGATRKFTTSSAEKIHVVTFFPNGKEPELVVWKKDRIVFPGERVFNFSSDADKCFIMETPGNENTFGIIPDNGVARVLLVNLNISDLIGREDEVEFISYEELIESEYGSRLLDMFLKKCK